MVVDAAEQAAARGDVVSLDSFAELGAHLAQVHPSQYGPLVADLDALHLTDTRPFVDQAEALRWVVLVDRLYDRDVPVVASGVPVDQLFTPEMLAGGYRKKYFRAISRLVSLARQGRAVLG